MRTCHICGSAVLDKEFCPTCVKNFEYRKVVSEMSVQERIDEMNLLCGVLEYPFEKLYQRIEELMDRPVWTHELGDPPSLIEEIRTGDTISLGGVVAKLATMIDPKKIIVIQQSGDGAE